VASPSPRVGPIAHAGVVELAVTTTLKKWLPTYLAEACRQHEITGVATPRSWVTASEYDRWPENQLPAIIVSAPGTEGEPRADGDRVYRADYELRVTAEIVARRAGEARLIGQLYAGAIRVALMQRRSLGDGLRVTDWLGESNATLGFTGTADRRTRFASQNIFRVTVPNLFTERGALTEPILEDPGDLVEITDYEIEVLKSAVG
jgi:hypothetical protein